MTISNKISTKPKIVICDLWQTLADTETSLFETILDVLGVEMPFKEFVGIMNKSDVFLTDDNIENTLPVFLSKFDATADQVSRILDVWKLTPSQAHLYRFSESWIRNLKSEKIPLALLTNIDRFGYEHFINPDFLKLFDYEFLSFREGIAKPNPECFLRICQRFDVHPTEVVMVGNSDDDILPAKDLGMITIRVTEKLNLDRVDFSEEKLF